jgi:hypothetical protein
MPGPKRVFALDVPGIHVFTAPPLDSDVDGRDKPGHDDVICVGSAAKISLF